MFVSLIIILVPVKFVMIFPLSLPMLIVCVFFYSRNIGMFFVNLLKKKKLRHKNLPQIDHIPKCKKTIKLPENIIGANLDDFGYSDAFLDTTSKA